MQALGLEAVQVRLCFGSGGAGNFLQRITTGIAIAFFLTSFGLAYYAKEKSQAASGVGIPVVVEAPVVRFSKTKRVSFQSF